MNALLLLVVAAGKLTLLDPKAADAATAKDPIVVHPVWASAGDGADMSSVNAGDITYTIKDNNGAGVSIDAEQNGKPLFKTTPIPFSGPEAGVGLSPKHKLLALGLARKGTYLYDAANGELRAEVGLNWALSPDETWVLSPPEVPFGTEKFNRNTVQRITLGARPEVKDVVTLELTGPARELSVAFSGDGKQYAVLDPLGEIAVYRSSDNGLVAKTKSEWKEAGDVSFSKTGKLLIAHDGTRLLVFRIDGAR